MPEKKTLEHAKTAKRQGKAASTQAGAFVKEQIDHVREGKHGVRSTKQAIAIGLSEARRAGVKVPAKKGASATSKSAAAKSTASKTKHTKTAHAADDASDHRQTKTSAETHTKRSHAAKQALKREGSEPVSTRALSKQGHNAASRRSAADRSAAAKKTVHTKSAAARSAAAKKAAHTRASRSH
jgi:Family of unknown function (DUF6496)